MSFPVHKPRPPADATAADWTEFGRGTFELKTNFVGAAQGMTLRCRAEPVHAGRSTQVWDAIVSDDAGRTVAGYRCTEIILWPRAAQSTP